MTEGFITELCIFFNPLTAPTERKLTNHEQMNYFIATYFIKSVIK